MDKKNILVLDTGKEWGGGTNSLLELLKRADKEKYRFTALFYYNYGKGSSSDIRSEIEKLGIKFILLNRERPSRTAKIMKEAVRILFFFSRGLKKHFIFRIDHLFRIRKDAVKVAEILREEKADLLYMNNQPSSNLEGIIASDMNGVKALQHSRIETALNAFEVRAVNQHLSKIICVSKGVMDSLINKGVDPLKCTFVHNGIDPLTRPQSPPEEVRKKYNISTDDLLIGTVGSLIKRKRMDDLIEAVSIAVKKSGKTFKCLIVGEGPEKENLIEAVKRSGLEENVIFAGFQPDALSFINAMDIFIMASEKEGFPRVILEAMHMGKPVIASDTVGINELVIDKETGILIPLGRPDLFAEAILRLTEDKALMAKMGEAARKIIHEKYGIDKYVKGVENIFTEILEG